MTWSTVAKKEFQDSLRSRWLIGLTALFVLFAAGFTYLFQSVPALLGGGENASTFALLSAISTPTAFLVPLIGLVIGYKSIVGERDSGSLKLLLGLPHTRANVVFGKLIGRTAVVTVSILVGFAAAAGVALALYDSFAVVEFTVFTLLTVIYGLVFIAIATGFSAGMRSTSWALFGAIGLYLLFLVIWDIVVLLVQYVVNGFALPDLLSMPDWAALLSLVNPQMAFNYAAAASIPEYAEFVLLPDSNAFYLQDWFGFVILALWIIVPLALGYLRFESTDL